jgi:dTDP-4-amino-4,6-dideoxygalactose transaminase
LNKDKYPDIAKEKFVKALQAEGIPCAAGYPYPLYRNRLFGDQKYTAVDCPEAERMCADTFWLSHEVMLSSTNELDDVISALERIQNGCGQIARI